MATEEEFERKSVTELRQLATEAKIPGRSGMNKDQLVAALANPDAYPEPSPETDLGDAANASTDSTDPANVTPENEGIHRTAGLVNDTETGTGANETPPPIADGVDEAQTRRIKTDEDAGLPTVEDAIKPGEPGPNPAQSAATRSDAKYSSLGE